MTDCKLKALVVLLAGIVGSTVAQAQTPAALIYDSDDATISFTWTNAPAGRYDLTAMATDNEGATGVSAAVPFTIRTGLQVSSQPGGQIQLQWAGGGTLQTATNVLGTWSDVSGAVSPCLIPSTNSAQFFRVKQ